MIKSVVTTLLLILTLAFCDESYGQVMLAGKVTTSTNCATTAQTNGSYNSLNTNAQGQQCITLVPSSNNDGAVVKGTTTNATAGSASVVSIATAPGQIYGLTVDAGANTANTVVWINFFNAATTTPGTTAALFSISTAAVTGSLGNVTPMPWGGSVGIPFSTALTANCTTTKNGATGCGSPANIIAITK